MRSGSPLDLSRDCLDQLQRSSARAPVSVHLAIPVVPVAEMDLRFVGLLPVWAQSAHTHQSCIAAGADFVVAGIDFVAVDGTFLHCCVEQGARLVAAQRTGRATLGDRLVAVHEARSE